MVIGSVQTFSGGFLGLAGGGGDVRGLRGKIFPWRNMSWEKINSVKEAKDLLVLFKKRKK